MVNKDNESTNLNRIKFNGSFIIPISYTKEEFYDKFNEFVNDNGLSFVGEYSDLIPIIKFNESDSSDDLISIWREVIKVIREELTEVSYNTWIGPITPFSMEENKLILVVENDLTKAILNKRYLNLLQSSMEFVTTKKYDIEIYIKDEIF